MTPAFSLRGLSSVTMTLSAFSAAMRAHDRAFAGIAVAAGTEHHHQFAAGIGPQRLERLGQRVRLVGVIDKYGSAVVGADMLQPALGAFEMFKRREHARRFGAGRDGKTGSDQRILDLNSPTSGSFTL
jgi:hypothetical protein